MPLDNRYISGTDSEVLAYNLNLDFCFALITDISRAVSRRSTGDPSPLGGSLPGEPHGQLSLHTARAPLLVLRFSLAK